MRFGEGMGSFEELLEAAGYVRDAKVVGHIPDRERPSPEEVDRLYDEVAEAASVDTDSLMLEFVPLPDGEGGDPRIEVAVWYDGDLEPDERDRIAQVLRHRFEGGSDEPSSKRKRRPAVPGRPT